MCLCLAIVGACYLVSAFVGLVLLFAAWLLSSCAETGRCLLKPEIGTDSVSDHSSFGFILAFVGFLFLWYSVNGLWYRRAVQDAESKPLLQ